MSVTVFLVVLWLAVGGVRVETAVIPVGIDCGDVGASYMAQHVIGNPNYTGATWSCFDVPKDNAPAA